MKKGVYKFAGQIVEILSNYSEVHKFCEDYESTEKPNFKIITTQEEINYEQSLYDEAFLRKTLTAISKYMLQDDY